MWVNNQLPFAKGKEGVAGVVTLSVSTVFRHVTVSPGMCEDFFPHPGQPFDLFPASQSS